MSIHYFFHIELLGDPSRQENEHTLQAKWFDRNGIDASMVRGNVIFDHIDSFLKAKKRNSFYPIDQLFQTDSQEMELTSKLCIRTQ